MTRLGTLRVIAPPPSPPQNSPPQPTTPAQTCEQPPQTPQTPSTSTPNPSPHPSPPTPLQQPPTPIRQPPLSKNLRWTAVALVSKLSKELERPSSAIADEVALAASHDMRTRFPEKDVAPVERNTRRRVYDALKVMVAVGCIQRHGKDLRWIGVDHLRYLKTTNVPNIRVSLCESRRRIGRKKAMLTEMRRTINAFDTLYARHHREQQWRNQHSKPFITAPSIHFPMILVNAQTPRVSYSPNRKRVCVTTQEPFKVYSETDLVTILADRTVLKRPKTPKKRKPARVTSVAPHSPNPKRPTPSPPDAASNTANTPNTFQPRHLPRRNLTNQKHLDTASKLSHKLTPEGNDPPKYYKYFKKSTTEDCGRNPVSTSSKDSLSKRNTQGDREGNKLEPRGVSQVKAESKEEVAADEEGSQTRLQQQILTYNIPTSSGPPLRHDEPDSERIGPSVAGTQGERELSTGPLICDEELGIPPLDDDDSSSPASDDDEMIGWKAEENDDTDFEQVFTTPLFHQVQ